MNRAGLIFVVAALVAGGAIGYVMGSSVGDAPTVYLPEERAKSPTPRPSRPELEDPEYEEQQARIRGAGLLAELRKIDVPKPERGLGSVTGQVMSESGEPINGAVVWVYVQKRGNSQKAPPKHRYKRAQGPPEDPELDEFVKTQVQSHYGRIAGRLEGQTDARGNFTVTGLLEDGTTYYAYAYARGYECRQNPYVRNLRAGMSVNFTAKPVYDIPVRVLMPDGSTPEDAYITKYQGNRSRGGANWFSDDPVFQLEPGSFQLQAMGGEEKELRSEKVTVDVPEEGDVDEVVLQLKHEPGVRGEVIFPAGEANLTAYVALRKLDEGVADAPDSLKSGNRKTYYVYSYRTKFLFRDITPGTYLIGLVYNNNLVAAHDKVEVGDRMVVKDLSLPPPDVSQYLLLTVEGPDGRAVPDVSFTTGYRAQDYNRSGSSRTTRLPSGQYRVFHYPVSEDKRKPDGTHYIMLRSQKLGTKTVEYDAGNTTALTVRFDAPAFLEVTVAGYKGSGMEGKVSLKLDAVKDGKSQGSRYYYGSRSSLDAEGRQKFGPNAPGEYDLTVYVKAQRSQHVPGDVIRVHLKAGDNTEIVSLPKLYTLTVVTDADASTSFRLTLRQNRGYWWSSSTLRPKDGAVVFDNIAAGEYTLQAWGGVSGKMDVSVPSRTNIRFEPTIYNAQIAHVKNMNGSLVKAGVIEGDMLVAIDGEEFTSALQMRALMTLANENKSATLTFLRGGRRLTITAEFTNIWSYTETGVTWEQSGR